MKIVIPEQLKEELPKSTYGKILGATPVVMTVIATMLAGLASSEMTRAQYFRSFAAQMQSKAGDQWNFFQAKRLRGAMQQNTVDMLRTATEPRALDDETIRALLAKLPNPIGSDGKSPGATSESSILIQHLQAALQRGELPGIVPAPPVDPGMKAALVAVESSAPESEIAALLSKVSNASIDEALLAARNQVQILETALKPITQAIESIQKQSEIPLSQEAPTLEARRMFARDFLNARLRYAASRYETEARLNQAIAGFYELKVRKSNIEAQRHHARSQRFFFGMLVSQAAVIISTFAVAARQRNLLWSLAAGAGLLAIGFAIYVYLYI